MTEQEIFDIATMIHHEWAVEMRNLETINKEKDDGSPDWGMFHTMRFKTCSAKIDHLASLKASFLKEHPLSI